MFLRPNQSFFCRCPAVLYGAQPLHTFLSCSRNSCHEISFMDSLMMPRNYKAGRTIYDVYLQYTHEAQEGYHRPANALHLMALCLEGHVHVRPVDLQPHSPDTVHEVNMLPGRSPTHVSQHSTGRTMVWTFPL
jgi:hypothetical protein